MIYYILLLVLFIVLCLMKYFIHSFTVKQLDAYQKSTLLNDFKSLEMTTDNFIGMHMTPLPEINGECFYVRRTRDYKGTIIFDGNWQLNNHFYMPLFNSLCRMGYFVVCFESTVSIASLRQEKIEEIIHFLENDEDFKKYPIKLCGHGTGATNMLLLDHHYPMIAIQTVLDEYHRFLAFIGKNTFYQQYLSKNKKYQQYLKKQYEKHFHTTLKTTTTPKEKCLIINSTKANKMNLPNAKTIIVEGWDYPYLTHEAQRKLGVIERILANPSTSQYDYQRELANFDYRILCELESDILKEILLFLENQ